MLKYAVIAILAVSFSSVFALPEGNYLIDAAESDTSLLITVSDQTEIEDIFVKGYPTVILQSAISQDGERARIFGATSFSLFYIIYDLEHDTFKIKIWENNNKEKFLENPTIESFF